ncbi:MAG: ABC transporter transmembrane domain-containing protein, partial [Pseudomonadota bacterium]
MTDSSAHGSVDPERRAKSARIGPLRGLMPYLRPYGRTIAGVAVALIAAAALTLSLPLALRRVIDGFGESDYALIDQYFGAFIGVSLALAVATGLRFYLVSRLGERVIADVRAGVFNHVAGMSPAFYERVMTAEVLTRLTTDTSVVQSVVGSTMSIALRNILLFFGGFALMLYTSLKLTALTTLLVPLVVIPILFLGRRVRRLSRLSQDLVAESATAAGEVLQAAQTVQAMTHVNRSRARFSGRVEAAYDAALQRIGARALLTVIVIFLVFSGIVGIVWMGARDVVAGTMSPGLMAQFVVYAIITAGAVAALSEVWGEMQRAAGATERLVELLAMDNPVSDPDAPVSPANPARGAISFADVAYAYESRPEQQALKGVSFSVEPGQTVALVGPSGAGKTTVLQMLLR